ncbi:MAG: hypothetical protein IM516_08460 [Pseudanabaena sp. M158S2SP1A06QC]|uniref:hypothetical protein n=1 Tax=Pseudanabaena mucicola TaxID=71190 RepID=UPI00257664AD|nr:hypothetical protein [Pseudanabaena mucicola]MCA6568040.1 hypothetical protein [Pseudanabaena sp. M065S1SP2A07QC]MCA6596070.1 hypothetical protein [Pseudanabaena sp. M046S1SP1A06QC]MCA6606269.1 hypothetical protein [Pseudanabaena sp. M007S1SP1A06QC]MCA6612128.1 hypothetical protein [Pseudanabaena sp. M158S2SP1A06QC]MCA6616006.1 hypothetical protein [Pseudanabaena sp. M090S1SP1A06QC]MCA6621996.1 hypothetical protein [Pseudanabaena sp. M165S2SP1A06QC]
MNIDPNEKVRQQFDLMPYPNLPASQMGGRWRSRFDFAFFCDGLVCQNATGLRSPRFDDPRYWMWLGCNYLGISDR